MGSMSASDAAPLPRLGEVFFDIRGSARSLRLSWYADTAVAVFSIWQAGTCTGTFRLPMADLQRMIETLRQGPGGGAPDPAATESGFGTEPGFGAERTQVHYLPAPATGPGDEAESGYRRDYAGERTEAHYLPAPADGSGYQPESTRRVAVSWPHNGEAVPGAGRPGRAPESFPYGPPGAPEQRQPGTHGG